MAKNTSVLLGDHFDQFIQGLIQSGRYASASEVVRSALRQLEEAETQKALLIQELVKGEQSGLVEDFDPKTVLQKFKERNGVA